MEKLRAKLTYANVISTLCLFLLLGGGAAFAASHLAKNSVGTKQIKNGAVTPPKISDSAQAALRGAVGPTGPQGASGEPGSTGQYPTALPSGATLRGSFFGYDGTSISFPLPLAASPEHHSFLAPEDPRTAGCQGEDEGNQLDEDTAAPGWLCVYQQEHTNESSLTSLTITEAGRLGAFLKANRSNPAEPAEMQGLWAYTAP